jgi:predicted nucleic acid-binding protein
MLVDTDFLIDLQRGLRRQRSSGAWRFASEHPDSVLHISLVTWMEFAEGFPLEHKDECSRFLRDFPVLSPDESVAWRASPIARELRQAGTHIGDHDVWIASTAIEHEMPLITRNTRHFQRVPRLQLLAY